VSLLFALVHHHVGSLVPLFVLALGLTTAYEATGCLLVPVFMHAIFNGLNILELIFKPLS
jgi:membrane protease YdiL (CAAX protease family)